MNWTASRPHPAIPAVFCGIAGGAIASFFTLFFGGAFQDAFFAFFIGCLTQYSVQKFESRQINFIVKISCTSVLLTLSALILEKLQLIHNIDSAIIGSLMLLVPGWPLPMPSVILSAGICWPASSVPWKHV